jgi:hypothetical protein
VEQQKRFLNSPLPKTSQHDGDEFTLADPAQIRLRRPECRAEGEIPRHAANQVGINQSQRVKCPLWKREI